MRSMNRTTQRARRIAERVTDPELPMLTLADLGVPADQVGTAGARTTVLEAVPRPPREDRVLVTDAGDAGVRLAAYLAERHLI